MDMQIKQRVSKVLLVCALVVLTLHSVQAQVVSKVTVVNNTDRTYLVRNGGFMQCIEPGKRVSLKDKNGEYLEFKYEIKLSLPDDQDSYSEKEPTEELESDLDGSPTRSSSLFESLFDDVNSNCCSENGSVAKAEPTRFDTFKIVHTGSELRLFRTYDEDGDGIWDRIGTLSFNEVEVTDAKIVVAISDEWVSARLSKSCRRKKDRAGHPKRRASLST